MVASGKKIEGFTELNAIQEMKPWFFFHLDSAVLVQIHTFGILVCWIYIYSGAWHQVYNQGRDIIL